MATPARRTSKTKKRSRRGHLKLNLPNVHYDSTIGEYTISHHVSPSGKYKGRSIK